MSHDGEPGDRHAPSAAALTALGSDDWAWLLVVVRRALHDLDDTAVTPSIARLRAAPTSRLAGGRARADLARLVASGGPAWEALEARLRDRELPPAVAAAVVGATEDATIAVEGPTPRPTASRTTSPGTAPDARPSAAEREVVRLREKLRQVREERDALRRRLEGAEARAEQEAQQRRSAEAATEQAEGEVVRARTELEAADAERDRAVARERRRGDARLRRTEEELRQARRRLQELQRDAARRERATSGPSAGAGGRPPTAPSGRSPVAPDRLVPGRPTQLPAGVQPGTREAVDLLLHAGRRVLVDGYNVTKQHHPELDLERQRAWLVQLLANAAARRRIEVTAVFDGAGVGSRPAAGFRDVSVRFTPEGVTADDELVLAVEATDDPVVVVTDDRELAGRVRHSGADVVGSRAFLWALR